MTTSVGIANRSNFVSLSTIEARKNLKLVPQASNKPRPYLPPDMASLVIGGGALDCGEFIMAPGISVGESLQCIFDVNSAGVDERAWFAATQRAWSRVVAGLLVAPERAVMDSRPREGVFDA